MHRGTSKLPQSSYSSPGRWTFVYNLEFSSLPCNHALMCFLFMFTFCFAILWPKTVFCYLFDLFRVFVCTCLIFLFFVFCLDTVVEATKKRTKPEEHYVFKRNSYTSWRLRTPYLQNAGSVFWHMLGLSDIFSHCAASHSFAHTAYVTTVPLAVLASLFLLIQVVKMSHTEKNRLYQH